MCVCVCVCVCVLVNSSSSAAHFAILSVNSNQGKQSSFVFLTAEYPEFSGLTSDIRNPESGKQCRVNLHESTDQIDAIVIGDW